MEENIDFVPQMMVHVGPMWRSFQTHNGSYQLNWLGDKLKYRVNRAKFENIKIKIEVEANQMDYSCNLPLI